MPISIREQFGAQWQLAFVTFMLRDSDFLSRVASDVRDDYFLDETLSRIVKIILAFYTNNQSAPDTLIYNELDVLRKAGRLSAENYEAVSAYLDELFSTKLQNREYLLSNFDSYIRLSKVQRYLPEFIEFAQEGKWEEAEKLMTDILAATRSSDMTAADFTDDVETRIKRRNEAEVYSLLHIPELDPYVKVYRGQINAFQSRASSDGKTAALVHLARYYLYTQLNVLIISLEESQEQYEDRLDQCLCNLTRDEIRDPANAEILQKGVRRYLTRGKLKIRMMLPAKTKVSDIDSLIESLIACDNFVPDVLLLDYADRCAPETSSLRGKVWEAQEEVYNSLDALAKKRNMFCWTAMQSNRKALEDTASADQVHTGGGLIKQQICRLVISINRVDKADEQNKARLKIVKNTYGPKGIEEQIYQDYERMQFRISPERFQPTMPVDRATPPPPPPVCNGPETSN